MSMTDATLSSAAPELYRAVESFICQNANFESSIVQQRVIESVGAATDAMLAFAIPLQNTILNMDGAHRWSMFWWSAIEYKDVNDFPTGDFSTNGAMALITQVYDIGYQEHVLQHFEAESDDEGDESEDDEITESEPIDSSIAGDLSVFGEATPDALTPALEEL